MMTLDPDDNSGPIRYAIEHSTHYAYSSPVRNSVMLLHLRPRTDRQRVLDFEVVTDPVGSLSCATDAFGNTRHQLNIHRPHQALAVTARSRVETVPAPELPKKLTLDSWREIRTWQKSPDLWDFVNPSPFARPSPALAKFLDRSGIAEPAGGPLGALQNLASTLHNSFQFTPGSTSAVSPIEHLLESRQGVCQDYAHVMTAVARGWGVPARYVSGYLYVTDPNGRPVLGTATDAWVECRLPGLDWVGFDPANNQIAGADYVRIAIGRDYRDVAPTAGIYQGFAQSELKVSVRMERISANRPERAAPDRQLAD